MNIKRKVEQIERRVQTIKPDNAPCGACGELWHALRREYGNFPLIVHSPAACRDMHANLEKAYGGGDDDGLKAAA